jgi:hypothetical protein
MIPHTRQELIDYCLTKLGQPVVKINVSDSQVNDRLDDAIQFYQEFHGDAVITSYRKHLCMTEDASRGWISVPDSFLSVNRVWPVSNNSSNAGGMWSARYQMMLNDIYDLNQSGSLMNYTMTREYLEMLDMLLNGTPACRFNRHMNRLYIDVDWNETVQAGDYIVIQGYETVNPKDWPKVYNDMWLKKYTTALIKRQWGENMKKMSGIVLLGGVTLNGQTIYDEAVNEIKDLEDECRGAWQMPIDFFTG